MLKKSKYDIMKKQLKGATMYILSLLPKVYSLQKKYNEDKLTEEQLNEELVLIAGNILPIMINGSHAAYENSKDIENIDAQKLLDKAKKKGISERSFATAYHNNKKQSVKILMSLALLDKENVELPDFKDPVTAMSIINGGMSGGLEDIFDSVVDQLSDETFNKINNIFSGYFELGDLTVEDLLLLDNYHQKYMEKVINPYINKDISEKEIINSAVSYGKPKKKR